MSSSFSSIRAAATDGRVLNPFYRRTQLKHLHDSLSSHAAEVQKAIVNDTGNRAADATTEYWLALQHLADVYATVDANAVLHDEYAVVRGKDQTNAREAVGIVVIHPATHAFLFCLLSALSPALAAGNCIIVQADQSMLETPKLVLSLVSKALDNDIFHVTYNEVKEADIGHEHIIVFQNGHPGFPTTHHLTSNPEARVLAVVERDADLQAAAESIVTARFTLQGRSPYAPDIVLVNEWVKRDFLTAVTQHFIRLKADVGSHNGAPARRRNENQDILSEIQKSGEASIISSGPEGIVIDVVERKSPLLQRKIKEACLLVHSVTSMDDAIDFSNSRGRLAASYVFATPAVAKYISQFLDTPLSMINHLAASILFSPIAPANVSLNPKSRTLYYEDLFSRPKATYVTPTKQDVTLCKILTRPSSEALQELEKQACLTLPEARPLKKKNDLGYFEQGILTGGLLLISTTFSVTGLCCYYAFRFVRPYWQSAEL